MNRKKQSDKQSMTSLQRQAVLVCVVCALAALLTVGITLTLLKQGKGETPAASSESTSVEEPADGEDLAGHYQIDNTSSALLTETADAGTEYQDSTLFLGDSNTVRLYNNGLISLQQFCAKEGIGTQAALNEGIVTFKGDSNHYTIAQAVAKMKPRRVVLTFGTNDTGMEVADFIRNYTALVQAIQESYPYADIIVNTVPPIPENHSTYPHMDQAKIDDFNMALLDLCEQLGLKFLNTAETLKGEDGYGKAEYYTDGDIHLKSAGLKAALNYLSTHAYQTEDRRPDTNNIPTRTLEYTSNPSSAVQAPSSEAASSESVSSSTAVETKYEARYQVEKSGGGTLSCGNDSGKTTLSYNITDAAQSLTVTATPAEGYVFVKWSDGVTSKTRTDTKFKQNLDVTAVFSAVSVHITSEGKGIFGSYIFKASLSGKYAKEANLHWFANGKEVTEAAGQATVAVPASSVAEGTYKIYAVVTYNDCAVVSNALSITFSGTSESASSSSSSGSSSSSSSSTSSSAGTSSGSTSASSSESGKSESGSSSGSSSTASSSSSSHSTAASESKSESASHSSSGTSESKAESASSSHSEAASSSHSASSASESKAESEAKSESKAESKTESKEQANTESVSASAENDVEPAASSTASTEAQASR